MPQKMYLNVGPGSTTLALPSGGSYNLPAGDVIIGDYFARAARAGILRLVLTKPRKTTKVHNPLKVAEDQVPDFREPAKAAVAAQVDTPKAAVVENVPPPSADSEPRLEGKTALEWMAWITSSDIAQEKMAKLLKIATFLGVDNPGATKLDVVKNLQIIASEFSA